VSFREPQTINVNFPKLPLGMIRAGIIAVIAIWIVFTSFYTIPADSVGIVLRFGRDVGSRDPGLHFKLPFGIDEILIVPVKRQLKLEFGFGSRERTNPDQISDEPELEKNMVTGDLNAALVEWVVQYHIDDPKLFLFHAREPGWTLRDLSEAVMREVIGDRTVDEVITVGREEIESDVLTRLRAKVKEYKLGFALDQVQLKNINPPMRVQASFNEVNSAKQERERAINVANGEYNKAVPRAKGEAEQRVSTAEGYKLKRVNEALGDVTAFNAVLAEYTKAPEVTRTRIYLETMSEVLPLLRDRVIVDEKVTQLLPLLPGAGGAPAPSR
jgi:membrane protease subunit HflK